jgi:hypothetical protein
VEARATAADSRRAGRRRIVRRGEPALELAHKARAAD